ncbi:hypothetical protein ACEPAG_9498 [Sanghuangporus baumii]
MRNKMVRPFLDAADELVLSNALERFRHAADDLWRAIGDCASLQKIDVEDYPDPFETLRSLRATVHHYHVALSDSREVVDEMIETFETEDAKQEVFDHKPLRLRELIKLSFGTWEDSMMSASIIAQKICSSSLRTLALQGIPRHIGEPLLMKTTSRGSFQDIPQSNPSFTELELCTFTNIDLCHIPSQVEVLMLTVKYAEDESQSFKCSGSISFQQIRLIRFRGFHERVHSSRFKDCVYRIREVLLASGLNAVQFEFQNCPRCIDGSFNLEDFRRAFLDEDDYIDYDFY